MRCSKNPDYAVNNFWKKNCFKDIPLINSLTHKFMKIRYRNLFIIIYSSLFIVKKNEIDWIHYKTLCHAIPLAWNNVQFLLQQHHSLIHQKVTSSCNLHLRFNFPSSCPCKVNIIPESHEREFQSSPNSSTYMRTLRHILTYGVKLALRKAAGHKFRKHCKRTTEHGWNRTPMREWIY